MRNNVTFICFMGESRGQLTLCPSPATTATQSLTELYRGAINLIEPRDKINKYVV